MKKTNDTMVPETDKVMEVIRAIIRKNFREDKFTHHINALTPKSKVSEILDSLDFVETIMDLEIHYNIAIPDSECEKMFTFNDMIKTIQKIQNGK